jgi:lipoprotein signal peptidase
MFRSTRTASVSSVHLERNDKRGQRLMTLALLAAVVLVDQAIKWWAWRHASGARINVGGDALVGPTVGGWYADPVAGALLDLVDFGLLSIAVYLLVRRRRPAVVLVPGALMIGGWSSNLLDRLGMHYWSAPGSMRGAIDFIPLDNRHFNVADFFIISGTLLFLTVSYLHRAATKRPAPPGSVTSPTHHRLRSRTRMSALVGAVGLIVVVGIGATNDGGVTAPTTSVTALNNH